MFLQTVNGRMTVFPNWKMSIDAGFRQLRADGAFLVSGRVAGGAIGPVTITSEKGLPCRIENPWPGKAMKVEAKGAAVAIKPPPARAKGPDGKPPEVLEFQTTPGTTYRIYSR